MPKIYDNIENFAKDGLKENLEGALSADFCVGYFNLRGWGLLIDDINNLAGKLYDIEDDDENGQELISCRLLVGMQKLPSEYIKDYYSKREIWEIDQEKQIALRRKMAQQFREQLIIGYQTDQDEENLRKLLTQLKARKVVVKLYLKQLLHAKLYVTHYDEARLPRVAMLGSSNLTMSGMRNQCELNVDFKDTDDTLKVAEWFEARWTERWTVDITDDLIEVLEESWVSAHTPFEIYLKLLYHLSAEARTGIAEFKLPQKVDSILLAFQREAVLRAAKMVSLRGGVMLGDVVGLGKTLMAVALAKLFDHDHKVMIICPPRLITMWEEYCYEYNLDAKIVSLGSVASKLDNNRPYSFIIIDESHNLRNRKSQRYSVIKSYIEKLKDPKKVVLLTATPYNKQMFDLTAQLRLFINEDDDIGIAPENAIRQIGGRPQFLVKGNFIINSIQAFEKSENMADWRELMRLYLVRRTRSFIKQHYATIDPINKRSYLTFSNGQRAYFPDRIAKRLDFTMPANNQYSKLYSDQVVNIIIELNLPRYGLGLDQYLMPGAAKDPVFAHILANLNKAGQRLKGFAKSNLFKRLESSGYSFLLSVSRHIMRNCVFIYAIEHNLNLPIGQQEVEIMDAYLEDTDPNGNQRKQHDTYQAYMDEAKAYYQALLNNYEDYQWISFAMFNDTLKTELIADAKDLIVVLNLVPHWDPDQDTQLDALVNLLNVTHPTDKVLIFSQFSDTAMYLSEELIKRVNRRIGLATGKIEKPEILAKRFSPVSNKYDRFQPELDVLVATDVLSEGQNLQDAFIVVNYDLPWAIIRLIQRAGRVDRLGQQSDKILCYSMLPTDALDKIITLRKRLIMRLETSDSVIGSPDEIFFDDQKVAETLNGLYTEKDGVLDDKEEDIDLASEAYTRWQEMMKKYPAICAKVMRLPPVIYSTKQASTVNKTSKAKQKGVIVYTQTANDNETLTWLDEHNQIVTSAQYEILTAAECKPDEPTLPKLSYHHTVVGEALDQAYEAMTSAGGHLGKKTSARYKLYELLAHPADIQLDLHDVPNDIIQDLVYNHPLTHYASDVIKHRFRQGAKQSEIISLAKSLYDQGRLCIIMESNNANTDPSIICSLGLA